MDEVLPEAVPESLPVPEAGGPERVFEAGGAREAIEEALDALS